MPNFKLSSQSIRPNGFPLLTELFKTTTIEEDDILMKFLGVKREKVKKNGNTLEILFRRKLSREAVFTLLENIVSCERIPAFFSELGLSMFKEAVEMNYNIFLFTDEDIK